MIARASAIDHSFPAISQASLASPRFPFGEAAYAYGSLFVDYLAKTRGAGAVRKFVEKSSAYPIPFLIDLPARQGFGVTFSRAYREWRDSVFRSVSAFKPDAAPIAGWRDLTREGVLVSFPRWLALFFPFPHGPKQRQRCRRRASPARSPRPRRTPMRRPSIIRT